MRATLKSLAVIAAMLMLFAGLSRAQEKPVAVLGSVFNWKIYDPGQALKNSSIAASATAARMPAEEESRLAEEYKILRVCMTM